MKFLHFSGCNVLWTYNMNIQKKWAISFKNFKTCFKMTQFIVNAECHRCQTQADLVSFQNTLKQNFSIFTLNRFKSKLTRVFSHHISSEYLCLTLEHLKWMWIICSFNEILIYLKELYKKHYYILHLDALYHLCQFITISVMHLYKLNAFPQQ